MRWLGLGTARNWTDTITVASGEAFISSVVTLKQWSAQSTHIHYSQSVVYELMVVKIPSCSANPPLGVDVWSLQVHFQTPAMEGMYRTLYTCHHHLASLAVFWQLDYCNYSQETVNGNKFLVFNVQHKGRDLRSFVIRFDFESYVRFEIRFVLMVRFEIFESALSIVIRKETIGGG